MERRAAALGSTLFLLAAPGIVAGVIPWAITEWQMEGSLFWGSRVIGGVLIAAGAAFLLHAFARFVIEGRGTPAPIAPTRRLVVGGAYRYVRNPMYLSVGALIVGQALLLGRVGLLLYAVGFATMVLGFVHLYEEPTLKRQFGDGYDAYRRVVPRWLPRLRPWYPDR